MCVHLTQCLLSESMSCVQIIKKLICSRFDMHVKRPHTIKATDNDTMSSSTSWMDSSLEATK